MTSCTLKPLIPPKSWVPGTGLCCLESLENKAVPVFRVNARLLVPNGLSHSASISSWYCPHYTLRLLSLALEQLINAKTIWKYVGTLLKPSKLSSFIQMLSKCYPKDIHVWRGESLLLQPLLVLLLIELLHLPHDGIMVWWSSVFLTLCLPCLSHLVTTCHSISKFWIVLPHADASSHTCCSARMVCPRCTAEVGTCEMQTRPHCTEHLFTLAHCGVGE